jgi:hypothetical protein
MYWNWINLSTPYYDPDTFFLGFRLDGNTYIDHDFGPGNNRGYRSTNNGVTWIPTSLGNNAMIRAIVRYETPSKDAAVKAIDYPGHLFTPDSVVTPVVTVKNTGQDTISFDVLCTVDTLGVQVYSSTKSVADLPPDSTYHVTFDNWLPAGSGYPCLLKVVTQLALDSLSANDTLELTTTPYTPIMTIPSGWALSPPTIDGTIDTTNEWHLAYCIDVSDLDGRYCDSDPARTIYLYVMNDSSFLYLAVDYHTIFHEESNSRFMFYFDDDNSGIWASDSSEGFYQLANYHIYGDYFFSKPSGWQVNVTSELIDAAVNVVYHLTYEVSIPLHETTQWLLNAASGDTIGFHCFMSSRDSRYNYQYPMWWPTLMDSLYQEEPGYYGDIVLAPGTIPGIESSTSAIDIRRDDLMLTCTPNPFKQATEIKIQMQEVKNNLSTSLGTGTQDISLKIYDVSGRVVKVFNLASPASLREAGRAGILSLASAVSWSGTDQLDRPVPAGVYFVRLTTSGQTYTEKVILLK